MAIDRIQEYQCDSHRHSHHSISIFSFPSWFDQKAKQTTKQTIGIQKSFSTSLSFDWARFRCDSLLRFIFAGQSTLFLKYAYLHYIEMIVRPSIKSMAFSAFIYFFPRSLSLVISCCYFFIPGYMTQENNKQFDLLDSKYLPLPLFRFIYCGCFFFSLVLFTELSAYGLAFCSYFVSHWTIYNLQINIGKYWICNTNKIDCLSRLLHAFY